MSAAEVMAALNTVEQDHRLVLEKVQALKEAVGCLLGAGGEDPCQALGRMRESDRYFATLFESHMEEEETTLFPLLERYAAGGADLVARLRREHAEIRAKREELGNCLAVAADLEDRPPRAVLRDVLTYGWELWELLDNHAHLETRSIHHCLGASLLGDAPGPG
jgi:iron-sulfur cluster repair protein YtfE (RIC family)